MAQTMTLKEHLQAFRDEIQSAKKKQDADAQAAVKAASAHLDAALAVRQAQMKSDRELDKARTQKAIDTLKTLQQKTNAIAQEKGDAFKKHLDQVASEADSALIDA